MKLTPNLYATRLATIAAVAPQHPLLPTLQKGYSAINALYMGKVWEEVQQAPTTPSVQEPTAPALPQTERDAIKNSMIAKKVHLMTQLRKISNGFHKCKTVAEGKEVSVQVNALFEEFRSLRDDIKYYETHGRLPPSVSSENADDFFEMPTDLVGIKKNINVCDATISQLHRELKQYGHEELNDPKSVFAGQVRRLTERLEKWEKKRKLLRIEREKFKKGENEVSS